MPLSDELELRWPRQVFLDEATRLADAPAFSLEEVETLLYQAFRIPPQIDRGSAEDVLVQLVEGAERFRELGSRDYWSQRRGQHAPAYSLHELMSSFVELIDEFAGDGFLGVAFPDPCVDDRQPRFVDPSNELYRRLGVPDLWPLRESFDTWSQDTFFDLLEAFHDLVGRPRKRWYHSWSQCGWHYSDFDAPSGRAIYRWRVNQLMSDSGLEYRLADAGQDIGRIVAVTDDARDELIVRMAERPGEDPRDEVRHAIAMFRGRNADVQSKRSAIIALAGVLERRRSLIKQRLHRKDEVSLFEIANRFAIRHQDRSQLGDYDPAFLDWVFWWYLSTVELTDRLLARE